MIRDLEKRWSRFLPSSEVSALNALDGQLGIVSAETYELIARAEQARIATAGAFNPLMLNHLVAVGYDRSWNHVVDSDQPAPAPIPVTNEPIELFPDVRGVRLPVGVTFDPGGIGKGLAGDLVAAELKRLGDTRSQVEVGGDVRVSGTAWDGGWWKIKISDTDHDVAHPASIELPEGGVATSSRVRRSWQRGEKRMHHLLDSSTGMPAITDLAAATVVAPTLWWAEVIAKIVVVSGSERGRALIDQLGMSAVLVRADCQDRYEAIVSKEAAA